MKKFLKNRVLPVVCTLSILISLCSVPAFAAFEPGFRDTSSVESWEARLVPVSDMKLTVLGDYFSVPALRPLS